MYNLFPPDLTPDQGICQEIRLLAGTVNRRLHYVIVLGTLSGSGGGSVADSLYALETCASR